MEFEFERTLHLKLLSHVLYLELVQGFFFSAILSNHVFDPLMVLLTPSFGVPCGCLHVEDIRQLMRESLALTRF